MTPEMSQLRERLVNEIADPALALIARSMLEREASESSVAPTLEADLERLRETNAKLANELAAADAMFGYIATTFGACRACWGLNRLCARCRGRGQPGSQPVDLDELLRWVDPALATHGMRVIVRNGQPTAERSANETTRQPMEEK